MELISRSWTGRTRMGKATRWVWIGGGFMAAFMMVAVSLAVTQPYPPEEAFLSKLPSFPEKKTNFKLYWFEMSQSSRVDFSQPRKSKHELDMKGYLQAPTGVDAVAVCKEFTVENAWDAKEGNCLLPGSANTRRYKKNSFNSFQESSAKVEIRNCRFACQPHAITSMTLSTTVVIGKTRDSGVLPAVVMEQSQSIYDGIRVRIKGLKMESRGKLTLNAEYDRGAAGLSGAFIEAIYALDTNGKVIGGGRWTEGDPFGKTGTLTWEHHIEKGQTHKSFKFIICTEYDTKELRFVVKEICQKT